MPGLNIADPIASQVNNVRFEVLSTEEVRAISVKQITNPITFDANVNPTDGGLYDPAMGPYTKNLACTTCKLSSDHCPGHLGHIELPTPVYHPIFFDQMYRLLRATCLYCNRFKLPRGEVHRVQCKLLLLHNGMLTEATELDNEVQSKSGVGDSAVDDAGSEEDVAESRMEKRERLVEAYLRGVRASGRRPGRMVSALTEERSRVIKDFMKLLGLGKKCSNCQAISPKFRRDGFAKIFEMKLFPKDQNHNTQHGLHRNHVLLQKRKALVKGDKKRKRGSESPVSDTSQEDEEEEKEIDIQANVSTKTGRLMVAMEVSRVLEKLFEIENDVLSLVYQPKAFLPGRRKPINRVSAEIFFLKAVAVPPTNFRPPSKTGNDLTESGSNVVLKKVIESTQRIRDLTLEHATEQNLEAKHRIFNDLTREFFLLQELVNKNIDSSKVAANIKSVTIGIKQVLEKKEGLFRKNMMGKRVNFAARSVISPDPNIETNEIGVPLVFAKKLTFPEPVTPHNIEAMREAVINGPDIWPGATHIEYENGRLQRLPASMDARKAMANQLLTPSDAGSKSYNKKVNRHLRDGDMVLMNRQPTLHKPSIMGHKARVLQKENTIRMHYANCNTYNADFDGDEMNMHLPQNAIGQAEARFIANTDNQYLVATSGKPLRGLIQDHIVMGVWLTNKETRFTRDEYQQLLYSCLRPEDGHGDGRRIRLVRPALIKPKKYWTGKQVITTILENIRPDTYDGLNLQSKSQVTGNRWGAGGQEEGVVIFDEGEFVTGILDKAQFGASAFGFVHSVYEVYGSTVAGQLLSILGRLFTKFLHMRAFTCGMDDLGLTQAGNTARRQVLLDAQKVGTDVTAKFVKLEDNDGQAVLERRLEEVLRGDGKQQLLDGLMNARSKDLTTKTISECLPKGLVKQFPSNQMQAMTVSGAKGSDVNASQISCLLGQQVLEGRRVPVMVSGRTLPSFEPFDSGLRAGGYVTDRFLTGVRPQEYYFHAMAGREGLIDTAVKTSRSGYLQRCLVKGLEGLKVQYDNTVRNSDGSLIQFLYGEDALDVTKQRHLKDFKFHIENMASFLQKLNFTEISDKVDTNTAGEYQKSLMKKAKKKGHSSLPDPVLSTYSPSGFVGSVSENFESALESYIKKNPDGLIKSKKVSKTRHTVNKSGFKALMQFKYMNSLVDPGESVGIVAAQSVGEPSTQMTLNTFHLAGHSAKNVTLGIPRLREIVMTASAKISTPSMTLTLREEISDHNVEEFAKGITKRTLSEVVENVTVREMMGPGHGHEQAKIYKIRLEFYDKEEYAEEYSLSSEDILQTISGPFLVKLCKLVKVEHRKAMDKSIGEVEALPPVGQSQRPRPDEPLPSRAFGGGVDDEGSDDGNSLDEGSDVEAKRDAQATAYDNDDEDELESDDDMEDTGEEDEEREKPNGIPSAVEGSGSDSGDAGLENQMAIDLSEKKLQKTKARVRKEALMETYKDLSKFSFDDERGRWCDIELEYDHKVAKILMVGLVEKVCKQTIIQQVPGIATCERLEESEGGQSDQPKRRRLSTEGVNLQAMWAFQHIIDPNEIFTNDIAAMLRVYGVEAARSTIINEMNGVFKGHGIAVDTRHLSLIADAMTRAGGFNPFNRTGMKSEVSPFLKMSFETTCNFLKDAVLSGDNDDLTSPSARIVLGKLSTVGTGSFDVLLGLP